MTDKATPRPWRKHTDKESGWFRVVGPRLGNGNLPVVCPFPVSSDEDVNSQNAALIVAAVNAYDPEREAKVKALVEAGKLALEYWAHRQQRYKNRHPAWVIATRDALRALGETV